MTARIFNSTSDQEWNEFNSNSPQGSIFLHSAFLNAIEVPHDRLLFELDGRIVASVLIVEPNIVTPWAVFPYQGIALAPSQRRNQSIVAQSLKITEMVSTELSKKYAHFNLRQHYSYKDLRGFQWFNYHSPEQGRYEFDLQYTGIIDFDQYSNFEDYLVTIRPSRRQDAKKIIKQNLLLEESQDTAKFIQLYGLTFGRQNIDVDTNTLALIKRVVDAMLSAGMGRLVFCKDADGVVYAAIVTLHDDQCTYYMFAAADPDFRSSGASTALLLDSIEHAYISKHRWFDMVGINSPQRGDFKTSFNASPVPIYSLSFSKLKNDDLPSSENKDID